MGILPERFGNPEPALNEAEAEQVLERVSVETAKTCRMLFGRHLAMAREQGVLPAGATLQQLLDNDQLRNQLEVELHFEHVVFKKGSDDRWRLEVEQAS